MAKRSGGGRGRTRSISVSKGRRRSGTKRTVAKRRGVSCPRMNDCY